MYKRQDLYFRLSGATVWLPPLRDRPREIPILAQRFLADGCAKAGRGPVTVSPAGGLVTETFTCVAAVTGDVDGDGQADLLWQQRQSGRLVTWLMNGLSRREGRFLTPEGPDSAQWQAVGLADLTGDGRTDLLLQHGVSGRVVVWELEGGVRRSGVVLLPELAQAGQHVVAVGDWNGDGKTDVVLWSEGSGDVEAWLLDGLSLLEQRKLDPQTVPAPWRLAGPR